MAARGDEILSTLINKRSEKSVILAASQGNGGGRDDQYHGIVYLFMYCLCD